MNKKTLQNSPFIYWLEYSGNFVTMLQSGVRPVVVRDIWCNKKCSKNLMPGSVTAGGVVASKISIPVIAWVYSWS